MNLSRIFFALVLGILVPSRGHNLSCYLCIRNSSEECGPEHLLPCPRVADRCVTHISKHVDKGYLIKRECGLGPCGFEDDMVNRGLGMDGCDRTKDEYSCVFCCTTDGCNKNVSTKSVSAPFILLPLLILDLIFFVLTLVLPLPPLPLR